MQTVLIYHKNGAYCGSRTMEQVTYYYKRDGEGDIERNKDGVYVQKPKSEWKTKKGQRHFYKENGPDFRIVPVNGDVMDVLEEKTEMVEDTEVIAVVSKLSRAEVRELFKQPVETTSQHANLLNFTKVTEAVVVAKVVKLGD